MRRIAIYKGFEESSEQSEGQNIVIDEIPKTSTSVTKNSDDVSSVERKQWTREQKLEFIDLHEKFNRKARAARQVSAEVKFQLKSSTYNPWLEQERKLRNAPFQ